MHSSCRRRIWRRPRPDDKNRDPLSVGRRIFCIIPRTGSRKTGKISPELFAGGHVYIIRRQTSGAAQGPEFITRAALAVKLHAAQGSPAAESSTEDYPDVDADAPYAEAVRWASSEGILSGYGDGRMGPEDVLNREQLVTILWRQAGSPVLMDHPGLTNYSDAADISRYAQPALAWAHQQGLIPAGGELKPLEGVTTAEVEEMLRALQ